MNFNIPTGSIKEIFEYNKRDKLALFVLLFCFCTFVFNAIFKRTLGDFDNQALLKMIITNIVLFFPILLCSCFVDKRTKCTVWPLYFIIHFVLMLTWFLHPEYTYWFLRDDYAIYSRFFSFSAEIYLVMIFTLFTDERKLFNSIVLATKIKFCFLMAQYVNATLRGYWNVKDYSGAESHWTYSLAFGYEMVFCAIVFLMIYLHLKKRLYLLLTIISFYTILTDGSRGTWICVLSMFVFNYLVFWKKYKFNIFKALIFIFSAVGICFFMYVLKDFFIEVVTLLNIKSRTIDMLVADRIMTGNGREDIIQAALAMIEDGFLFGYGILGDRPVISQLHFAGYPHNIFLEMFIQFGVVMGSIILGYLIYKIIQMIMICHNDVFKILFVIYLSNSMKLLISDSFWNNSAFWGLIGVIILWNWKWKRLCKHE